jgi:hypothetical protein
MKLETFEEVTDLILSEDWKIYPRQIDWKGIKWKKMSVKMAGDIEKIIKSDDKEKSVKIIQIILGLDDVAELKVEKVSHFIHIIKELKI